MFFTLWQQNDLASPRTRLPKLSGGTGLFQPDGREQQHGRIGDRIVLLAPDLHTLAWFGYAESTQTGVLGSCKEELS
jgi:hypothetical protein